MAEMMKLSQVLSMGGLTVQAIEPRGGSGIDRLLKLWLFHEAGWYDTFRHYFFGVVHCQNRTSIQNTHTHLPSWKILLTIWVGL